MDLKDIKAAYKAQREYDSISGRLNQLYEQKISIKALYMGGELPWYIEDKFKASEKVFSEQMANQKEIVDRVMNWAEAAPDEIQQIIRARVLFSKPWEEISLDILHSNVPNTAYMRLKRFLDSAASV